MECPLCDREVLEVIPNVGQRSIHQIECGTCGTFLMSPQASRAVRQVPEISKERWRLSAASRRASDASSPVELTTGVLWEAINSVAPPMTPFDAMDRTMRLFASRIADFEGYAPMEPNSDYPLLVLKGPTQMEEVVRQLINLGKLTSSSSGSRIGVRLTLDGWRNVEQLRATAVNSNRAFVAMWFESSLDSVFNEGIVPALTATGYEAVRVDRRPHNERIDDEIIAGIKTSSLLIAEFTGQRQSVYYEAGLAQGLGIPVIRLCREDEIRQIHFDTRQYYHIPWTDASTLRAQLEAHIRATIPGRAQSGAR